MIDDPWFLRFNEGKTNEGKTMVDSMNRREILRLTVRWPLAIKTETGVAHMQATNMTGEGSLERTLKRDEVTNAQVVS